MKAIIGLEGSRFGQLMVLSQCEHRLRGQLVWLCLCDCGNTKPITSHNIRSGKTRSCGCLIVQSTIQRSTTHGLSHSMEYNSWAGMWQRCTNPKSEFFADYGGRGIKVCKRWSAFEAFVKDMGKRPPGSSIERINNEGDYEPSNCLWSDATHQANNRRSNRRITFNGRTMTVAEWSRETGLNSDALYARLKLGWDAQSILSTPIRRAA